MGIFFRVFFIYISVALFIKWFLSSSLQIMLLHLMIINMLTVSCFMLNRVSDKIWVRILKHLSTAEFVLDIENISSASKQTFGNSLLRNTNIFFHSNGTLFTNIEYFILTNLRSFFHSFKTTYFQILHGGVEFRNDRQYVLLLLVHNYCRHRLSFPDQ